MVGRVGLEPTTHGSCVASGPSAQHQIEPSSRVYSRTRPVGGLTLCAVGPSCQATDEEILHAMSVERLEDPIRLERRHPSAADHQQDPEHLIAGVTVRWIRPRNRRTTLGPNRSGPGG